MLLKVVRSDKLQPSKLVTHRFALDDVMKPYDTFGNAAKEGALKAIPKNQSRSDRPPASVMGPAVCYERSRRSCE